jgi:hypothetical protein
MGSIVTIKISGDSDQEQMAVLGRVTQMLEYLGIQVTYERSEVRQELFQHADTWRDKLVELAPTVHVIKEQSQSTIRQSPTTAWPIWAKECVKVESSYNEKYDDEARQIQITQHILSQIKSRKKTP